MSYVLDVVVSILDRDLSAFERVHSLFDYSGADTDAFLNKLTDIVTSSRQLNEERKVVEGKINQSNWTEGGGKKGTKPVPGEAVLYDPKQVTLEGLQVHK